MIETIALHPLSAFAALLAVVLVVVTTAYRTLRTSSTARLVARTTALAGAVIVIAILGFVLLASRLDGSGLSVRFDEALAIALAQTPSPKLAGVVATITHLGDRATLIALVVAIGAGLSVTRHHALALAWTLTCAGNGVLNPTLKSIFERARPVHDAAYATVGEYSFPSGHTSGSVVVYGMLAQVAIRLSPARWHLAIVLAATTLVVTVGCSRIYLRVHWASDVAAGFASGAAWLALCLLIATHVRHRRAHFTPR